MASRYTRKPRQLPGVALRPLEDREWQIVLLLVRAGLDGRDLGTAEVARQAGITADHARHVLENLPGGLWGARPEIDWRWQIKPAVLQAVRAHGHFSVGEELEHVERALDRRERPLPKTRADEARTALAQAESLLNDGDLVGARHIVLASDLSLRNMESSVSPRERPDIRARAALLNANLSMQTGAYTQAIHTVNIAIRRIDDFPPEEAVRLLVIRGAAERMESFATLPRSVASYDQAIMLLQKESFDPRVRTRMLRWVYAARSTPLFLQGRVEEAERSIGDARHHLTADDHDGIAETALLHARLLLQAGKIDDAAVCADEAEEHAAQATPSTRGWIPRYRADIQAHRAPADGLRLPVRRKAAVLEECAKAWALCRGYGFQRRLLLARLAACRVIGEESVLMPIRKDIYDATSAFHRLRHGNRTSDCPTCADEHLWVRIRHALGIGSDIDWRFLM